MSRPHEIALSRPTADHSIEQFLMNPEDLTAQVMRIGPTLRNQKVFFLGDDDHISPLLAQDFGVFPVVYEYDRRVRENLTSWFGKLGIENFLVKEYDALHPINETLSCDAFYINPPYSSKSNGLGIKVWLMRALEACKPNCTGILVMPRNGGNIGENWVDKVSNSVDSFMEENGLSTTRIETNISAYAETTQPDLMSSNVYIVRTEPSKTATINPSNLYN